MVVFIGMAHCCSYPSWGMEVVGIERAGFIVRLSRGEYLISSSGRYPEFIVLLVTVRSCRDYIDCSLSRLGLTLR